MRGSALRAALQAAAAATGNGEVFDVVGMNTCAIQITGTFVATVTFEATINGGDWIAVPFTNLNSGSAATTATAAGLYRATVSGLAQVRARISAYTSGSITAVALAVAEG